MLIRPTTSHVGLYHFGVYDIGGHVINLINFCTTYTWFSIITLYISK